MKSENKFKAVAKFALAVVLLCAVGMLATISSKTDKATAATIIGVPSGPAVNSAGTALTNCHTGFNTTTTNPWPVAIIGGDAVTNIITFDASSGKDLAVEFDGELNVANGAATGQNAILTLYGNVRGGAPTNSIGTAFHAVKLLTLPLTITSSSSSLAVFTAVTNMTSTTLKGAVPNIVYGVIDCGNLTNISYLTNYSVWLKPL